jgi:hypothetical protein
MTLVMLTVGELEVGVGVGVGGVVGVGIGVSVGVGVTVGVSVASNTARRCSNVFIRSDIEVTSSTIASTLAARLSSVKPASCA